MVRRESNQQISTCLLHFQLKRYTRYVDEYTYFSIEYCVTDYNINILLCYYNNTVFRKYTIEK